MELVKSAAPSGVVLQIKIRLLGLSPMVWRRVLVPESMSLHELHGVVQLAMGWEAEVTQAEEGVRVLRIHPGEEPGGGARGVEQLETRDLVAGVGFVCVQKEPVADFLGDELHGGLLEVDESDRSGAR